MKGPIAGTLLFVVIGTRAMSGGVEKQRGDVRGTVKDQAGAVIGGATVSALVPPNVAKQPMAVRTDVSGNFAARLPQGTYNICASASSFTQKCSTIRVRSGRTKELNFVLALIAWREPFTSEILDRSLRRLAGTGAKNCSHVRASSSPKGATKCVLQQVSRNRPFYVRYDEWGVDSEVAGGLAGNATGVVAMQFDSFGTSPEGYPVKTIFEYQNRLISLRCPMPLQLRETESGRITCFMTEQSGIFGSSW